MKTRMWVLGVLLASLSGCATTSARPENDPEWRILVAGVKALTEGRQVEGSIQYRDQAETNAELWNLSGRQTVTIELLNEDQERVRRFVEEANAARLEARNQCRWWRPWAC